MKVTNEILDNPFSNLYNIYRFSNTHLEHRESTAEHTMKMQLIALYLYNKYPTLDINNIIMRILYHDLDEMVLCDIPRDIKYHDAVAHEVINKIAAEKLAKLKLLPEITAAIDNSKHDGSLEGELVAVLDVIQCTYKLYSEWLLQHSELMKHRLVESLDNLWSVLNDYSEMINKVSYDTPHKHIHELFRTSCLELESEIKYNKHTYDPKMTQYIC